MPRLAGADANRPFGLTILPRNAPLALRPLPLPLGDTRRAIYVAGYHLIQSLFTRHRLASTPSR